MDDAEGQVVSDPVAHYVAGALAGSANIITGYPFDTGVQMEFHMMSFSYDVFCFPILLRAEFTTA